MSTWRISKALQESMAALLRKKLEQPVLQIALEKVEKDRARINILVKDFPTDETLLSLGEIELIEGDQVTILDLVPVNITVGEK